MKTNKMKKISVYICVAFFIVLTCSLLNHFYTRSTHYLESKADRDIDNIIAIKKVWLKNYFLTYANYTSLIVSKTQLRKSLNDYSSGGELRHLEKVQRILNDTLAGFSSIEGIKVYSVDKDILLTIGEMKDYGEKSFDSKVKVIRSSDRIVCFTRSPLYLGGEIVGYIDITFKTDDLMDFYKNSLQFEGLLNAKLIFLNEFEEKLIIIDSGSSENSSSINDSVVKEFIVSPSYLLSLSLIPNNKLGANEITQMYLYGVFPLGFGLSFLVILLSFFYLKEKSENRFLRKERAKANNELSQIIYRTSHDLRAPLTSISALSFLLEEELKEEVTEIQTVNIISGLHDIQKSSDSLTFLIDDLMATVKSDLSAEVYTHVSILEIVEDIKSMTAVSIRESRVQLLTNINVEKVWTKKRKLTQIIYNIVVNSIKYRDESKVSSYVSLSINELDGEIFIKIEDNGIGISQEHIGRIFEMFSRFSSSASSGSGLGLYLVNKDVDNLKGRINVISDLELGTTFTIILPQE